MWPSARGVARAQKLRDVKPTQREALLIYLASAFEQRVVGLFLGHGGCSSRAPSSGGTRRRAAAVAAEGQRWQRKLASSGPAGARRRHATQRRCCRCAHLSAAEEHRPAAGGAAAAAPRAHGGGRARRGGERRARRERGGDGTLADERVEHAAERGRGAPRRAPRARRRSAALRAVFGAELAADAEEDELLGRKHDAAAAARDELRAVAAFASSRDAADGWAVVRALVSADIGAPRRRAALEESLEAAPPNSTGCAMAAMPSTGACARCGRSSFCHAPRTTTRRVENYV